MGEQASIAGDAAHAATSPFHLLMDRDSDRGCPEWINRSQVRFRVPSNPLNL
jgi:hypothetical protein